jgi:exopolysaccharide production protein ExoZ
VQTDQKAGDMTSEPFYGLQYLRAAAALMVVVHHARHFFGDVTSWSIFGSTGVDIFFIISGFIMVHATRKLTADGDRFSQTTDFLMRRAIRIVPLYWLALLFHNRHVLRNGTADAGLLYDFGFIPRFNPVHGGEILPSLIVGWTLNFEVFFYILFGIAILFGSRKHLVLAVSILALVTAGAIFDLKNNAVLRVWTSGMLGEFALGMGVYLLVSHRTWLPNPRAALLIMLTAFAVLALPNEPVPRLLADGVPAALIVWSGVYVGRAMHKRKLLALLGDASYSIYLTHVFALPYCYRVFHQMHLAEPTPLNVAVVLTLSTVFSAVVGVIVYRAVEKPLLEKMTALWTRRRAMAPSAAGV